LNKKSEFEIIYDLAFLLEHYVNGRPLNWDGTTKRQVQASLRDAKAWIDEHSSKESVAI
jgi:hypothetical protein